ncbi:MULTISPECIES: phage tail protein [unclassified Burkholderia]|uniref:phage tail protein n=1 Tax=unclassified Burkholderia TaxID=2613784 RepID=UPI00142156C1|nr:MULTISPECIES: phage tail protein [unclassified Burkholderia]NIE60005.1 phage tail protein [Burkholderia sp. Ap-955]NIF12716.1 phage tail protein [Burkholderia sp. Ax-1735]NIG06143.1 phage tail protein [Burkholderia sp. Tr-849]
MATQIIITDAGRAALVAAGNGGTNAHQVVEIGLANAPFVADKGLTKLPNELKRIQSFGGANVAPDTIHTTLKDDSTDQYSLYGFGLYLDNGVLLAAYGQTTPIMEKSPAALLLLSSDMQFTAIDATKLVFGDASFLNPPATTERQGVVELATQAEVNAGADDTRAVTPKTAASRYAALTGARFTGPVVTEFDAGPDTAHVTIRPPTGKNGRESRVRLHGTFGGNHADIGTRLIATVRAGFDNGAWGREYVDLWVNKTGNDAEIDANQARALRIAYGGRMLVGDVKNDDGSSRLQVDGNSRTYGTSVSGGQGTVKAWVSADDANGYFRTAGNATIGSENANGSCDIVAGNAARVRVLPSGRMLVGTSVDDGRNVIQAAGSASFKGAVTSRDMDANGAHFRMVYGDYGAFLRNDGTNVYLLSTKKGDLDGQWNDFRPFAWSLADGTVRINGSGAMTYIGGELSVGMSNAEAHIRLGSAAGYIYGNAGSVGWWGGNAGAFQYFSEDRTFRVDGKPVWHTGNLPNPIQSTGFAMSAGAQILAAEGTPSAPGITFINDGKPDTGLYHINDGSFGVTCNSIPQVSFTPGGTVFQTPVQGPTPATGDRSKALATTEWVLAALSTATVGQIVFEPRTLPRAGFLKANGVLVNRADYPALWAYAQASGTLVSDDEWRNERWGCFSTGDGTTTFRLPELRGEFIRCWADGRDDIDAQRGIGSYQGAQNRSHTHGASVAAVGDHVHSAWTDSQGWHGHHGWTAGVGDHQHVSPWGENPSVYRPPWGTWGSGNTGSGSSDGDNVWGMTSPAGGHNHEFNTEGAGTHGHNVGIGGAGNHSHAITVNADGGNEARPRNIALLAMIRAY